VKQEVKFTNDACFSSAAKQLLFHVKRREGSYGGRFEEGIKKCMDRL